MKKKTSAEFDAIMKEHRARVVRLSEKRGVAEMKKLYDETQAEVARKLRRLRKASEPFQAHHLNVVLAQLKDGQAHAMRRMADELGDVTQDVAHDSLRSLTSEIARMEKHYKGSASPLPIDEASVFRKIVSKRRQSMLRQHETSMVRYGASLVTKMEDELSKSILAEENYGEAVDRIVDTSDVEWWKGEQIVRTESMFSFSATRADGLSEAAQVLDDLRMRWVEHVDDSTFEPLDDRVAKDSIALHAQVVVPLTSFKFPNDMPDGGELPEECERYVGRSFAFPPDRPNDRASLAPWRPGWGIPAWELVGWERKWLA